MSTAHARTVDALLQATHDTTLTAYLLTQRLAGHSYNRIARNLYDLTRGAVAVTGETIRNWTREEVNA